jgi:hypothetical protein
MAQATDPPRVTRGRAAWWATLSILVFGASLYLALPLVAVLPGSIAQAVFPLAWGGLAMGGLLLFARTSFGAWPRVSQESLAVAVVGLLLAGALVAVLRAWADERFGYFSAQLIGPTAGLFAAEVAGTVAGFAVFVAPRGARTTPALVVMIVAVAALGIGLLNVPGVLDGIAPGSLPLAALVGAAVAYTLAVALLVLRRIRASGA